MRATVVVHESTRTGAPLTAVETLRVLGTMGAHRTVIVRRQVVAEMFDGLADEVVREPGLVEGMPLHRLERRRFSRGVGALGQLEARRALRHTAPDLVYVSSIAAAGYARAAADMGCPTVLHVHELGVVAAYYVRLHRLDRLPPQVRLVAPSFAAAHDLAFLVGRLPDVVEVIRPPVRMPALGSRSHGTRMVIGGVGLLDEWKGPDLWLDVLDKLVALGMDAYGVWVGDGALRPGLERRVKTGPLRGRVRYLGERADLEPAYREMDVFVLTSRLESLSLVLAEAMAHGIPSFAFDVGGVREVVGGAGVLVTPGDVDAMAHEIADVRCDTDRWEYLAMAGPRRVRDVFSPEAFESRLVDVFQKALGGSH